PTTIARAPADIDLFQDFALTEGWSDGMPVLPPTAERVERILGALAARRAEVIATLAPRRGVATLETIAANLALAGALPEHLPVVVAAIRALADPRFNLNAIQTTTHPCTPLLIVNGPIVRYLAINAGANALGQGHRANAVIGRAVRLTLQNIGGARPGREDRATLGHPGKYSYCLAENEAESARDRSRARAGPAPTSGGAPGGAPASGPTAPVRRIALGSGCSAASGAGDRAARRTWRTAPARTPSCGSSPEGELNIARSS